MSINSKKSMGWTGVLILLGLVALFGGEKWLVVLIPAAMLVWYGAGPLVRGTRN
jgi:low affinity Fe/Cu permease